VRALFLGGPADGQVFDVDPGVVAVEVAEPLPPVHDTERVAPPHALYYRREVAMFGRRVIVFSFDGLTEAEGNDAAWQHVVSPVVQSLDTTPVEPAPVIPLRPVT
jgi:hypothetical protein